MGVFLSGRQTPARGNHLGRHSEMIIFIIWHELPLRKSDYSTDENGDLNKTETL